VKTRISRVLPGCEKTTVPLDYRALKIGIRKSCKKLIALAAKGCHSTRREIETQLTGFHKPSSTSLAAESLAALAAS